jgi:NADH:ubiquinone oxidoreductase subunit E
MTTMNVEPILRKYPRASRDILIPILQEVQGTYGYLSRDAVIRIGKHLALPASKIYGVATFYNQFRFQAPGLFHVQVCRGTACHVKGSAKLLETLIRNLKIEPGRTTRDRLFSLETVACMGACALSPVMCINGEFHAKVSSGKALMLLEECRLKGARLARA